MTVLTGAAVYQVRAVAMTREEVAAAYAKYGHLVMRRARSILRNEDMAKDALQEVFIRVLRYGDALARAESPIGWLYRVTDRVCFDLIKGRAKRPELDEAAVESAQSTANPACEVADRDLVMRFLDRFDDRMKELAILYFLDELPQERIAEELGWSRQTVNKKIAHIRERAAALSRTLGVSHG